MDRASQVLAQGLPPGVPQTYAALSEYGNVPLSTVHHRARGRRSREEKAQSQQYLTPPEEKAVVKFVLLMSELGQPVRVKHISSLAFSATQHRPVSDRPPKPPGRNWPKALEKRHPILKAKRVRALDWNRHDKNINEKIIHWFEVIGKLLQDPTQQILPENIYNMDETGVMLAMLACVKVLVGKDDIRDYRGARVKRTMVTAIECISGDGRYLDPMIIWSATTHRSNWTTFPTPGWHYACSQSGYTDSQISLEWLRRVFDPQTKERANQKPRVLICDGFGTHETLEILEFCFKSNIILCRIPSHTSHKLQPCDVAVFGPLKAAYRDQVERLERGGVNTIGKAHFTSLYSPARAKAFTKKNILAGWAKCGLLPFNPNRVPTEAPKPTTEQSTSVTRACEIEVGQYLQDEILQTPVTSEAVTSLHTLIKQDTHADDTLSKQRLQRHLQKLANAAQTCFAERALLQDQNRFLFEANNEAKVRRSTKSKVLGKAKVMSYEDLEEARARRAEKEAAKETKSTKKKSGRKSAAPEAVEAAVNKEPGGRKRKCAVKEVEGEPMAKAARTSEVQETATAPVAWMSEAQGPAPAAMISKTQEVPDALLAYMKRSAHCGT